MIKTTFVRFFRFETYFIRLLIRNKRTKMKIYRSLINGKRVLKLMTFTVLFSVASLRDRGHFALNLYLFLSFVPGTNKIKCCFEISKKYFWLRQFQRVVRWRDNRQYFILGLFFNMKSAISRTFLSVSIAAGAPPPPCNALIREFQTVRRTQRVGTQYEKSCYISYADINFNF